MLTISAANAQKDFDKLMTQTIESHEPVVITGTTSNVVMLSQEDWRAVEETLYLNSIPGLAKELLDRHTAKDEDFIAESELSW